MTRPASMRLFLLSAAAAALLLPACVVDWNHGTSSLWGQNVEQRGDTLFVDDVALPFHRWVDAKLDLGDAPSLEVGTASDQITLSGVSGNQAQLSALIYSEIEGDGKPVLERGRLVAHSDGGHKVFINAVKGTVPEGLALRVASGTGAILVEKLAGNADFRGDNGTNTITLRGCSTGAMVLASGTGDMLVERCQASRIRIESGTGDARLQDCSTPELSGETGTGALSLQRLTCKLVTFSTGTGDITAEQCELGTVDVESGTGNVLVDGGQVEKLELSTGTGTLDQRNGARIGSIRGQ